MSDQAAVEPVAICTGISFIPGNSRRPPSPVGGKTGRARYVVPWLFDAELTSDEPFNTLWGSRPAREIEPLRLEPRIQHRDHDAGITAGHVPRLRRMRPVPAPRAGRDRMAALRKVRIVGDELLRFREAVWLSERDRRGA